MRTLCDVESRWRQSLDIAFRASAIIQQSDKKGFIKVVRPSDRLSRRFLAQIRRNRAKWRGRSVGRSLCRAAWQLDSADCLRGCWR